MKKIRLWLVCMWLAVFNVLHAQQDSLQISLLTCSPGTEIYSLFGHTALRVQNFSRNLDVVFNYGMFSFNTPHFIYRFIKGETDYQLGVIPYVYFEAEYAERGSSVYQQVLNLSAEEKQTLLHLLTENYLPENRTYRYNYFYDNCTTRARDQIERCIKGTVVYPDSFPNRSFRSIVHEFTVGAAWDELGIDLCLGAEADTPIDKRQQMFSPFYMKEYASDAYIIGDNGQRRPLVLKEEKVVDVAPAETHSSFLSPLWCATFLLAISVLIGWWQWRRNKICWIWELLLFGAQGIAGCIIAFLFFFSVHPTVGSNWLLILFNPIPLLYLPFMVYFSVTRRKDWYHVVNMVYLTLFIVIFPFCLQEFNLTVLPLALSLLVTSASHVLVLSKKQ
ncbi:DUF4105 domain-containing protein [uncultured Phocaeicola sp.]|jgi:hypothetical protein|uniref:lipoprotein N-acyltransferase Lnb n=1 Tax=uncultured Phocaeicola sp. TaxID=990718 RepID=UPI0030C73C01